MPFTRPTGAGASPSQQITTLKDGQTVNEKLLSTTMEKLFTLQDRFPKALTDLFQLNHSRTAISGKTLEALKAKRLITGPTSIMSNIRCILENALVIDNKSSKVSVQSPRKLIVNHQSAETKSTDLVEMVVLTSGKRIPKNSYVEIRSQLAKLKKVELNVLLRHCQNWHNPLGSYKSDLQERKLIDEKGQIPDAVKSIVLAEIEGEYDEIQLLPPQTSL